MKPSDTGIFIDANGLKSYAANAASATEPGGIRSGAKLSSLILSALSDIRKEVCAISEKGADMRAFPKAEEWLTDNWYLAEREGKNASRSLKNAQIRKNEGENTFIISEAASALVLAGRGVVTEARMAAFLNGFQSVLALNESELAVFIPALAAELVFFLRSICRARGEDTASLFENIFTSLRFLGGFDASELLQNASRVEAALRQDPSGEYLQMDDDTRALYRREVSRIAARVGMTEEETAKKALVLAEKAGRHIGVYLFEMPLGEKKSESNGGGYIALNIVVSLFFAVLFGMLTSNALVAVLTVLPVSETVKFIIDTFVTGSVPPRAVMRMELPDGVPDEARTLCAVSFLLTSESGVKDITARLEGYMLTNRDSGRNLSFAVLADLAEAAEEVLTGDAELLETAKRAVDALNEKYRDNAPFYFLYRKREYSEKDRIWMAKERKRGAISELIRLMCGKKSTVRCLSGDVRALCGMKYLIALDSDTKLTAGSAREMVGAMLHPLNRPVLSRDGKCVVRGHAIIRPRVETELMSANTSDFTRIFAGAGGVDPYGSPSSDVYQDLFGLGSFAGKGIIDVNAYDECLDGVFPDNTVLSHDLLEGAYLRSAYMSDTVMTDGYPYRVASYFARMDRWVRGDWQSSPWLFGKVKNTFGERVKNPLGDIDRWKIFDNIRRSLVPGALFLSLIAAFLLPGFGFETAAAVAAVSVGANLVLASVRELFRRGADKRSRYHSTVIHGFPAWLLQTLLRFVLLPYEAYVCVRATARALWRMCVSKRNMLQWVTAADSERGSGGKILSYYSLMFFPAAAGVITAVLTPYAPAAAVGAVWFVSPAIAWALGRKRETYAAVRAADRDELLGCAADIRRYFEDLLTAEDNWLPPDNYQTAPAVGTAHRTSPTNIGLAVLASIAACDLGLAGRDEVLHEIDNMLGTIEKMEKWRGHLYNWYDTRTLKILRPAYVSTVDSGNFAACLVAAENGLREYGGDTLARRCRNIVENMDFMPLYDGRRRLFYIGWDAEKNAPVSGHYDLLASEARLLSYFAVARGYAPRKHWRALGRALASKDGFCGLSSWTGTMFEYMMPDLLLPCPENSLIYESRAFCLYAQRRRAKNRPWGESESAYFAFDHALSYKYKAHGIPRLALKRGMEADSVVSPYSSFLALCADARASVENLRELRKLGAVGKYGFFEAVDYTPSRMREGRPEIVRTYMAHHIGMSIIAVDNLLCRGVMQKRFMADAEMGAYIELLEERVPLDEVRLNQVSRDVPEKMPRAENAGWAAAGKAGESLPPKITLLSDGAMSAMFADDGRNSLKWGQLQLVREPGIIIAAVDGDEVLTAAKIPIYSEETRRDFAFTGHSACFFAENSGIKLSAMLFVDPDGQGMTVKTTVTAKGESRDVRVCLYLEPVLAEMREAQAHPAFLRLMLECDVENGRVTVKRRGKSAAMCVMCDSAASFETSRLRAFGRAYPFSRAPMMQDGKPPKASPELCVLSSAAVTADRGREIEVCFAVSAAYDAVAAKEAAATALKCRIPKGVSRMDGAARLLGMTAADTDRALLSLSALEYCLQEDRTRAAALKMGGVCQQGLWRFGISGDVPILAASLLSDDDIPAANELLKMHALLKDNGAEYDLVFLLSDGGDYRRAQRTAIYDCLRAVGNESEIGEKGGVHMIDAFDENARIVIAMSRLYLDLSEHGSPKLSHRENRVVCAETSGACGEGPVYAYNADGSFSFLVDGRLPDTAWQNILTNGRMGFVATDAGTGSMWMGNAREYRINSWKNDHLTQCGAEDVSIVCEGREVSLFAKEDGYVCRVTYGCGFAVWEKTIGGIKTRMQAFVPADTDARVLIIEIFGNSTDMRIRYRTDLVLGAEKNVPVLIQRNGTVTEAESAGKENFPYVFRVAAGEAPRNIGRDGEVCELELEWSMKNCIVLVAGCDEKEEILRLCDKRRASAALTDTKKLWEKRTGVIKVKSPSAALDAYLNGWALYQTLACRVLGRTSIYQSGGAYGFRDQLQDVSALISSSPDIVRAHIVKAASRQYEEGDVQHWWHETNGKIRGVRTRCSDDLLWLPYTLCEYTAATGDMAVCEESVPYIRSPELADGERDRYESPEVSRLSENVLRHAQRACDMALLRGTGEHGLCLIGGGDWNDGFDAVGRQGRGESVWLTWFASAVLMKMSELCGKTGDGGTAGRYSRAAEKLRAAAAGAWDGSWYLRGYFDNGKPLGSGECTECRIDSIAQSFAVFAGECGRRTDSALASSVSELFDRENGITSLFLPPFSNGDSEPGYIKNYAPGFRENGGQYTHAAIWLAMALLRSGKTDDGFAILESMLPFNRDSSIYKAEPYVLAADIYGHEDSTGRGGWTWYTGASGWYWRAAVEELLGLKLKDGKLVISPKIPDSWYGFSAEYLGHSISVGRDGITVDGAPYAGQPMEIKNG